MDETRTNWPGVTPSIESTLCNFNFSSFLATDCLNFPVVVYALENSASCWCNYLISGRRSLVGVEIPGELRGSYRNSACTVTAHRWYDLVTLPQRGRFIVGTREINQSAAVVCSVKKDNRRTASRGEESTMERRSRKFTRVCTLYRNTNEPSSKKVIRVSGCYHEAPMYV